MDPIARPSSPTTAQSQLQKNTKHTSHTKPLAKALAASHSRTDTAQPRNVERGEVRLPTWGFKNTQTGSVEKVFTRTFLRTPLRVLKEAGQDRSRFNVRAYVQGEGRYLLDGLSEQAAEEWLEQAEDALSLMETDFVSDPVSNPRGTALLLALSARLTGQPIYIFNKSGDLNVYHPNGKFERLPADTTDDAIAEKRTHVLGQLKSGVIRTALRFDGTQFEAWHKAQ